MDLDAKIDQPMDDGLGKIGDDTPLDVHIQVPTNSPSGSAKPMFKDVADAEARYKQLQRNIDQKDTALSESQRYKDQIEAAFQGIGGAEKAAQTIAHLQSNPSFRKWAEAEQTRLATGNTTGEGDMSDAEKKGLEIVDNRIKQFLSDFKAQNLDPQVNANREANLDRVFEQMDQKHTNWREMQGAMEKLSSLYAPEIQENPKFEHVELLYKTALAQNENLKTPEQLQQEIAEKHKLATGTPESPTGDGAMPKVDSIEQAFEIASR